MEPTNKVVLVGHPFAPIGRGEDIRCSYRALRSVAVNAGLLDVFSSCPPDKDDAAEFSASLVDKPGAVNIFHLNGDEIENAASALGGLPRSGYNIVYPAWELACYPQPWAAQLDRFDEIWAPSKFIAESLCDVVHKPVHEMSLASEVMLTSLLNRRFFGVPHSAYTFLFFFDFRSYRSRKNPEAVIAAFRRLRDMRPNADVCLVIKVSGSSHAPEEVEQLKRDMAEFRERAVILDRVMSDNQIKNLIRSCDCFISLHRSEGFGRGLAEAMYLEKPVIATAYSGNMDFMNSSTAMLVDYGLIPVGEGEYPYYENQVWADANTEQAADHMAFLVDNRTEGTRLGKRASLEVRSAIGYRPSGLRYKHRIESILGG